MGTEGSIFNPVIITIIGSQVGIVAILVAAVVPLAFRIGRLPTREEHTALQKEVTTNKEELKAEIANAESRLRAEIENTEERLRAEIEKSKNEVLQEIRRSHQQTMLALATTRTMKTDKRFSHSRRTLSWCRPPLTTRFRTLPPCQPQPIPSA